MQVRSNKVRSNKFLWSLTKAGEDVDLRTPKEINILLGCPVRMIQQTYLQKENLVLRATWR